MSRYIGKVRQAKFVKNITTFLNSVGAVKVNSRADYYLSYEINTKAGKLSINIDTSYSIIFSIFTRFEEVEKAKQILGNSTRLNSYCGKWNFHYNSEDTIQHLFERELSEIIIKKNIPITEFDKLEKMLTLSYEAPSKLVFDGETYEGRLSVDPGKYWDKPDNTIVVICDGTACFITRRTPFQIWKGPEIK